MVLAGSVPSGQVGVGRAVGGVIVERLLERGGLADVGLGRIGVGVDGAVQDHRPHVLRIGLGVAGPDPGAVGVTEIGQLLVAECGAHRVEILDHIDGSDVGKELLAHLVHAALNELLGFLLDVGDAFWRVVDLRIGAQPVVVGVGVAPHRGRGVGHPAGIEADQIEALAHGRRQRVGHPRRRLDTRLAGAAGVDDQRTDLVPGRRNRIIAICATSPSGFV